MIPLKLEEDIKFIEKSALILTRVLSVVRNKAVAGISMLELDSIAEQMIIKEAALPAFKGYRGYPATICASLNEEIVHGIPDERVAKDGDILSIDIGVNYSGYFADAAITVAIGKITPKAKKLIDITKQALAKGVQKASPGNHLGDISYTIQNFVEQHGFSVVREFVGHGIGKNLHEEPEIPNFGRSGTGPVLKAGMVLAIEPMVNVGIWQSKLKANGWTAVTADGELSAHFEHTVLITEKGPRILTNG